MGELIDDVAFDEVAGAANEPVWLTGDEVIRINQRLAEATGAQHRVTNPDLLADGVERPRREWVEGGHHDVADLAGLLLLEIGKASPFEQGNKQTALAAANVFLEFNGYSLVAPDVEPLAQLVDGAIAGTIPEASFLRAMRASAIPTDEWRIYQGEQA